MISAVCDYPEIIVFIIRHIPYISKICVSIACKLLHEYVKLDFGAIIKEKINLRLINVLAKHNCAIIGSTVLDCLLGTNYAQDINIVTSSSNNINLDIDDYDKIELFADMKKIGAISVSAACGIMTTTGYTTCLLRRYVINCIKIDIIICNISSQEYISEFSFDFCKNVYNVQHNKLNMLKPLSVLKKCSKYTIIPTRSAAYYYGWLSEKRHNIDHISAEIYIEKYQKRGFVVDTTWYDNLPNFADDI